MFQKQRFPAVIVTRNRAGKLCAVGTNMTMCEGFSGVLDVGSTQKYLPEIQWPQAWKLVKCTAKDAIIKITGDRCRLYLWKNGKWTYTGETICGSFLRKVGGKGFYYLEYVKDGKR